MHERLSFYVKRDSLLHNLNPLTKLTLAFGLTFVGFLSPWYLMPVWIILFVILPLSFVGRVQREYLNAAWRLILPATGFLFTMRLFFNLSERRSFFNSGFCM
jgi:energy-coupling factor transporter transmembrane protein EcfT